VTDRSILRLTALWVVVISLLLTLVARLFYMQVIAGQQYHDALVNNQYRTIYTTAPRGMILDQLGRPLVDNRSSLVVTIDPNVIARQADKGHAVLVKLGALIHIAPKLLRAKLSSCGAPGAAPRPLCSDGSPFEPVTVAKDVSSTLALQVMEDRASFPGVTAGLQAVRDYPSPYGVNMAHILGYLGSITEGELAQEKLKVGSGQVSFAATDLVGRAGLEASYNNELRGKPGITTLAVNQAGIVTSTVSSTDPTPGNYLISTIDARVQAVAEQQLAQAIQRAHRSGYKGDSGAVVVMDNTNGDILAMASQPTYNPKIWVGGISAKDYKRLNSTAANIPLLNRAIQGAWAPASTFKVVTTAATVKAGYGLYNTFPCTSSIKAGNLVFTNYHNESFGQITLARALEVSCDTVFYHIANSMWLNDGGVKLKKHPKDYIEKTAAGFGLGKYTGIDLPGEVKGSVGGRGFKLEYWKATRKALCHRAKTGYPEIKDRGYARLLKEYAVENCVDGWKYRVGDALNLAIGQGDTTVTPIQEAVMYSAIANGGTRWTPRLVKGVESPTGKIIKVYKPVKRGKLPASSATLAYLRNALTGVDTVGTAAYRFTTYPMDKLPIAAKTGTGEVVGKDFTSWFSTFAPANHPRYTVVMVVSQGGTGSGTCGPSVRRIYEALFGIKGKTITPKASILAGGKPSSHLPKITPTGVIEFPGWKSGKPTTNWKLAAGDTNAIWTAPFVPGLPKGNKD
jgi:penicillin-binding protein 2